MSGTGGIGGVGGVGSHGASGGMTPAAARTVSPSKGTEGASSDGGKDSLVVGVGNVVGNTQTQTINNIEINNFDSMGAKDFCALHNMTNGKDGPALEGISEMSSQDLQKMLAALLVMKLIQQLFEQAQELYGEGGSASGVGSAASMNASAGGGSAASSAGSSAGGSSGGGSSGGGSSGGGGAHSA